MGHDYAIFKTRLFASGNQSCRPLTKMNLTAVEKRFEADYPGKFGRFSDGEREILLRPFETGS